MRYRLRADASPAASARHAEAKLPQLFHGSPLCTKPNSARATRLNPGDRRRSKLEIVCLLAALKKSNII
jgi:hypothetical protein